MAPRSSAAELLGLLFFVKMSFLFAGFPVGKFAAKEKAREQLSASQQEAIGRACTSRRLLCRAARPGAAAGNGKTKGPNLEKAFLLSAVHFSPRTDVEPHEEREAGPGAGEPRASAAALGRQECSSAGKRGAERGECGRVGLLRVQRRAEAAAAERGGWAAAQGG